ncbi:MAG: hypothetical protein KatS3mg105_1891 [Gemmatales bacterium]|nr:MAG: hypothetical protein KatS3mg105_1891 [Gemmatales bacterium]
MKGSELFDDKEIQSTFWRIYRDYFDMAERRRRWNIREDIPWDQVNPNLDPVIADVIESFCAVELYLPGLCWQNFACRSLQQRPNLVLLQLGLRRVEAFAGSGGLAAQVPDAQRRTARRHGKHGVRAGMEPAARQSSGHADLCHDPGTGNLAQLSESSPPRCRTGRRPPLWKRR